jgi:hypothetical protein
MPAHRFAAASGFVLLGCTLLAACAAQSGPIGSGDGEGQSDNQLTPGPACGSDVDCNHGAQGLGLVCASSGSQAGTCIDGCHGDSDCAAGQHCDTTASPHYLCTGAPPSLGTSCASDSDCNLGKTGTERVCGSSTDTCIMACHSNSDCPSGIPCNESTSPWSCGSTPNPGNGCPILEFPSGIHIQTVPNAAMSATYTDHLSSGQTAPTCFLDVTHLDDPVANQTYDMSVYVATHFQLVELVGTEVDQGYGNFVLLNPTAVASLEKFREDLGVPVEINSGFRGPRHQEDTCRSICGDPLGCAGTCANNSRHMWGDAFDLPMEFYTTQDTNLACSVGFKFTYLEAGTHLHIDQNPAYSTCVQE